MRISAGLISAFAAAAMLGLFVVKGNAMDNPLDTWAWNYRPFIVVAPAENDARLVEQRAHFSGLQDELRERDLAIVELVGDAARIVTGPDMEIDAARLRDRLGPSDGRFEVVLMGKDTGIKLRSGQPVTAVELFDLIDSMPMRRQEMKQ